MVATIFILVVLGWLVSLVLHEYAHARVAYAGGDHTVREKGYLSLNPVKYMDPIMSFVIPALILAVGGVPLPGGAVYINTHLLRGPGWDSAVSAAGPAANLAVLLVASLPFTLGLYDPATGADSALWLALMLTCYFQVLAILLNLLPVPPLDGWGIIEPWVPAEARQRARQFGHVGIIAVIALLWFDNPVREAFYKATFFIVDLLGIPPLELVTAFRHFSSFLSPRGGA